MRLLVSTQIFGHLDEFKALLEYAKLDLSNDKLILLGDYLQHGNQQKELIDYLIELNNNENVIILKGLIEEKYLDVFYNHNSIAEQNITRENNLFYEYLDNKELRKKHLTFLKSLKDNYCFKNYLFSNECFNVDKYNNIFVANKKDVPDDIIEEDNLLGLNFNNKIVGLVDITNRQVYKIELN